MGNYKFRLSDMMPNAWFYKLRDMNKAGSKSINKKIHNPRKSTSFYQTNEYISPNINPKIFDNHDFPSPRKSSKTRSKRKTIYKPSPKQINPSSASASASASASSSSDCIDFPTSPDQDSFQGSSPCSCKLSSSATDIIIDMDQTSYKFSDLQLPPILTKPPHPPLLPSNSSSSTKEKKKKSRKSVSRSSGVKIKGRWNHHHVNKVPNCKKNENESSSTSSLFYSESFAIVKASLDPEHDFRESMMEMIVENNIRASKDLEDLLACYLSLNSNQYHHLIIKAFEQIWFNMPLN